MSEMINVAVDAMGGDYAPDEVVKGTLLAVRANPSLKVTLVGKEMMIRAALQQYGGEAGWPEDRISIFHTSEVIEMAESPVKAIMEKKDSSIVKGMEMVHDGECDAFVTAGSSGATLVGGQTIVGRIKGIERPPLAPLMPTTKGPVLLIDCGANVDAKPSWLLQFAQMGSIYMENIVGVDRPRVAILNIGAEDEKGNALVKETFPLLQQCENINFIGSIEARDPGRRRRRGGLRCLCRQRGAEDVRRRGIRSPWRDQVRTAFQPSSKIGALLIKPALKGTLKKFDTSTYGGAPLLGLNGLVVKSHGNSKAIVIQHAIEQCITFKEKDINGQFRSRMKLVDRTKKKQPQ